MKNSTLTEGGLRRSKKYYHAPNYPCFELAGVYMKNMLCGQPRGCDKESLISQNGQINELLVTTLPEGVTGFGSARHGWSHRTGPEEIGGHKATGHLS